MKMTSELSFLIELLLKHKLPVATKDMVAQRIAEIEEKYSRPADGRFTPLPGGGIYESPGYLAKQHPALPPPPPVAVIAQTPEAQAAMASRQAAINQALSGKPEKGQTSPRKF